MDEKEKKREMKRLERQIKKMLQKEGDIQFVENWFNLVCPLLEHKTPKMILELGRGQEIIDRLAQIFKDDEIARGIPFTPESTTSMKAHSFKHSEMITD